MANYDFYHVNYPCVRKTADVFLIKLVSDFFAEWNEEDVTSGFSVLLTYGKNSPQERCTFIFSISDMRDKREEYRFRSLTLLPSAVQQMQYMT